MKARWCAKNSARFSRGTYNPVVDFGELNTARSASPKFTTGYNACMIRTVIKWVLIAAVIILILLWLWAGGFTSVRNFIRTIPNPIDIIWGDATSTYQINLPWQSAIPQGPDISGLTDAGDAQLDQVSDEQGGTNEGGSNGAQQSYGTPSPYRGMVTLPQ